MENYLNTTIWALSKFPAAGELLPLGPVRGQSQEMHDQLYVHETHTCMHDGHATPVVPAS